MPIFFSFVNPFILKATFFCNAVYLALQFKHFSSYSESSSYQMSNVGTTYATKFDEKRQSFIITHEKLEWNWTLTFLLVIATNVVVLLTIRFYKKHRKGKIFECRGVFFIKKYIFYYKFDEFRKFRTSLDACC